ncbi:hypothetical protein [Leisingera caerulea]|uniref:hypothetical protein n=1 Tax=Leisingera caerulea TaxID=506591 RepID=UPI0021A8904F|nr:hypothetical protein [Leisingera caerulea]UWQ83109.1 hypothetical protein K3726_15805 [Leisingera caerulea]
MSEDKKRPVETIHEGRIKASIWENEHDGKTMHAVQMRRTWQDKDGNFRESDSFSSVDLLQVSRLAERSHDRVRQLKEEMREAARNKRTRSRDQIRSERRGYER